MGERMEGVRRALIGGADLGVAPVEGETGVVARKEGISRRRARGLFLLVGCRRKQP
jgi:hypothetical protein